LPDGETCPEFPQFAVFPSTEGHMKNFEIAVSGMCRRAVIARFRSLDDDDAVPVKLTKDERDEPT
jgi:hypothetical protein